MHSRKLVDEQLDNDSTAQRAVTIEAALVGSLTALVVEDDLAIRLVLEAFMQSLGYSVLLAQDGADAIEQFKTHRPDLVLMDVIMPLMDGVEATKAIRTECGSHWVPIIVLSALSGDGDVVPALAAGADDYIGKPVNLAILRAKIESMRRIAAMQARLESNERALAKYQRDAEAEMDLAIGVIGKMIDRDGLRDPLLRWWVQPAGRFSGDVVAALRGPDGSFYIMLADATGHGLSAAISLFPALNVFYGVARKGLSVGTMTREMNGVLKATMPVGRYLAAQVCRLDVSSRSAELWNGGMPQALMVSAGTVISFASMNMPLGILDDASFDANCQTFNWSEPGQVYLFSDGLVEAENRDGKPFRVDTLQHLLGVGDSAGRFDAVTRALALHLGGAQAHDDISLLAVELA
jgi:CheY-like chemotaxis protein